VIRKYAGVSCIVLGVVLSGCGLDSAESIRFRWSQLTSGWTVNGPLLIAGILSLTVGLTLWHLSGKAAPKER